MSASSSARRVTLALAAFAAIAVPLAAQNPAPAPAPAPAAPMQCDSACHARMGHGPGATGQAAPMGGMGAMGGMQGGMMMCPMMGNMHGMGGMQGQGGMGGGMMMMHGQQGMGGMGGMGGPGNMMIVRRMEMGGAPDTANMRQMADTHAMMTRAYYDALVRRGFTPAQALQIVASQEMPGPGR